MENTLRNSARFYDFDERDNLRDDIPFYREYAEKYGGGVLELGCGTGRVAIPLAQAGHKVTGLDLSDNMLALFGEKLNKNPELKPLVKIVKGDMSHFQLGEKFGLITAPFRAFQCLTEDADIDGALSSVREHLAPGGVFILNVFNPHSILDKSWCYGETVQWERTDKITGLEIVKKHWGDKIDTQRQIIYPHFAYEVTYPDGKNERVTDDLKLKYYYYPQLRALVEEAGFEVAEEYSWYDKTPIGGREIIFVCKARERV